MKCVVLTCRDPFNPGRRDQREVRRRRRIAALAPRTRQPVIAYHNGRVILRAEWRRRVRDGDEVSFVVLPTGGGGKKNPLSAILSIALMAVSGPLAGAMLMEAGAIQVLGSITLKTLVAGAIGMVGNALISSAFAGKPSLPSPQAATNAAAPSPTYNLQAQGNMARLGSAIPVQYGYMMAYPDLAAMPYAEYSGNEQYVYELLCLGKGSYEIDAIRIEDTPIGNFPEIQYEVIEPGGTLTLFPANVVTSTEVSGQELLHSSVVGPFVANAAGTTANTLAIDVVCPRGLYYANDSGGLSTVGVSFTTEARAIDSGGAPLGSWATLGTESLSAATNTPQRYSFRYTVAGGRYEVRCTRTTAKGGTARHADDLMWVGLRAYLPETRTWADETLIALRMRASNSLSNMATRKINVLSTRKLPIYSGGAWTAPQVTRSPAWAMADALRAEYGGRLADSRIDLAQLQALAATYAARGDTFDGRFDAAMGLWEGVKRIGQAVRTKPYLQGGIAHFVRDEAASVPRAMFSMRNIVRGSFSVDYLMASAETADCFDMNYFDGEVWAWRTVRAKLSGSAEANPLKVDLFGVTNRDQAWREGMYLAGTNFYRRKTINLRTELEGLIPAYGDLITISHDMPAWGTSGEVTAVEAYSTGQAIADWTLDTGTTSANDITGPDGSTVSRAFTDDSAVAWEPCHALNEVVVSGTSYTRTYFVKKDAVSNRFVLLRFFFTLAAGGGTDNFVDVNMRTDTGAHADAVWGGGTGSVTVVAWDATWWRVTITASAANGNNRLWVYFYPAVGVTLATQVASATGTATLWTGPVTRLTLSEPVTFTTGAHYIGLRQRDGSVSGPYACTAGRNAYEVVVAGLLDATPYTGGSEERTHFAFGKGETWRQPARVTAIRPRGMHQVEIEAVNEDDSVHTADTGGTAPAAQYSQLPNLYTKPLVTGLTARSMVGDPTVALVSWQAAPGARYYVVDVSADGDSWSRVGETTSNNITISAVYGADTLIRVAAFGFALGPSVQIAYETVSDYMWSGADSDLMWTGSDSDLMWS